MMESQKSLTLRSRSFLGHTGDVVAAIFTKKDGRWYDYGVMSPVSQLILQDAWPEVIDAPLTLIFGT